MNYKKKSRTNVMGRDLNSACPDRCRGKFYNSENSDLFFALILFWSVAFLRIASGGSGTRRTRSRCCTGSGRSASSRSGSFSGSGSSSGCRSGGIFCSHFSGTRYLHNSNGSLMRIEEFKIGHADIAYFNSFVKVQMGHIHIDMIGHVFRKRAHFERGAFSYQRSTFFNTGSFSDQTGRDVHFYFAVFTDTQKVGVENDFTYRMELNFLQDGLTLFPLHIEVNKMRFVGVDQVAKQNHRRVKMHLVLSAV